MNGKWGIYLGLELSEDSHYLYCSAYIDRVEGCSGSYRTFVRTEGHFKVEIPVVRLPFDMVLCRYIYGVVYTRKEMCLWRSSFYGCCLRTEKGIYGGLPGATSLLEYSSFVFDRWLSVGWAFASSNSGAEENG